MTCMGDDGERNAKKAMHFFYCTFHDKKIDDDDGPNFFRPVAVALLLLVSGIYTQHTHTHTSSLRFKKSKRRLMINRDNKENGVSRKKHFHSS